MCINAWIIRWRCPQGTRIMVVYVIPAYDAIQKYPINERLRISSPMDDIIWYSIFASLRRHLNANRCPRLSANVERSYTDEEASRVRWSRARVQLLLEGTTGQDRSDRAYSMWQGTQCDSARWCRDEAPPSQSGHYPVNITWSWECFLRHRLKSMRSETAPRYKCSSA